MAYPPISAGQRLTAQMLRDMQWHSVVQGTEQVVVSSAVKVDTNIIVPMIQGATYMYRLMIGYKAAEAVDMRFAWTVPSGGEVQRFSQGLGDEGVGGTTDSFPAINFRAPLTESDVAVGGVGAGNVTNSYYEQGMMQGGVGGNAVFQFAQKVADANDVSITGVSRCDYLRIG